VRINITLDCTDLDREARFWSAVLGYRAEVVVPEAYVGLEGPAFTLTLQRVPEPKITKNRMHLDLLVADLAAESARIETLGATRITPVPLEMYGERWLVLADPEGNEFCLGVEG
jgi:catechol 2,3-dioxygenase-like lactoylglutathione lyase family enzyme